MRLGQLARKYDVSPQEIISYLMEIAPGYHDLHHNSKLDVQTKSLVAKRFDDPEKLRDKAPEEIEQKFLEQEITDDPEELSEVDQGELDTSLPELEVQEPQKKEEVVIETDKLLELLESEETSIDLSKITRIKASKKELDGLKVVGKIELPEPKIKAAEKSEQQEKEPKPVKNARHQRRQLSVEEQEKRRLKAEKRKEEYEARKEKRKKAKERKRRKALNETRYQQKLRRSKSNQPKLKDNEQIPQASSEVAEERPKPKTLIGKFWRWMKYSLIPVE